MRVLTFLVSSFIFLAVMAAVIFVMMREVLLWVGVSQIQRDAQQLREISRNAGAYIQQCRAKGITSSTLDAIKSIQLRFLSPTEYVVEVVCAQFSLDPILVKTAKLPLFVTKTLGSSGIDWMSGYSGIGLEIWSRSRAVLVEQNVIRTTGIQKLAGTINPITSCAGNGYSCCQAETSQGVGAQLTKVSDCPQTCFEQCQPRPVILSLSAQPNFDPQTRTVQLTSGEPLDATYILDPAGAKKLAVTVTFGNGESQTFSEANGRITTSYTCQQSSCQYQLSVTAEDLATGVTSAATSISTVTVVVYGR